MAKFPKIYSTNLHLANTIAMIVDYAWDDFRTSVNTYGDMQEVIWSISYIVSCFLAQHTVMGEEGVDTETGYSLLKCYKYVPYDDRLELAIAAVKEWGGVK